LQKLDGNGRLSGLKFGLKVPDLPSQGLMLRLVSRQVRIVIQLHQPFLVGEMAFGILHQPFQDRTYRCFSVSRCHGIPKPGCRLKENLMLRIDAANADLIALLPFEHALYIGWKGARL